MRNRSFIALCFACLPFIPLCSAACQDNALTVDRIYSSGEFRAEGFSANWADGSDSFRTFKKSESGPGRDLVFVDPTSGDKSIFMAAKDLVPEGADKALNVSEFFSSPDNSKVLIYTNTKRVWRYNTRGDYWVLDRQSKSLNESW